jgi:hypothetical protein
MKLKTGQETGVWDKCKCSEGPEVRRASSWDNILLLTFEILKYFKQEALNFIFQWTLQIKLILVEK